MGQTIVKRHGHVTEWYLDGKLQHINGPAVESADGTREWWVNKKQQPAPERVK